MLSEEEVTAAIEECEKKVKTYGDCEKLATFYTIRDHMTAHDARAGEVRETIGEYGDTDFLRGVAGKDAAEAWLLMDEVMTTLSLLAPRLYNGIIAKLR